MIYGYARVSTKGQAKDGNGLEAQEKALVEAGAERIFREAYTGTKKHRPQLDELLGIIGPGDMVVVAKLDRIARSTKDGIEIIEEITKKGCTLNVLNMGRFDDSPTGRLLRNIMLAFAEFERDMIVQRTMDGKAIARQNPEWREGAPKRELVDFASCHRSYEAGEISVQTACEKMGISESTWYRRCRQLKAG